MNSHTIVSTRYFHTGVLVAGDMAAICLSLILAYITRVWLGSIFQLLPLTHSLILYLVKGWIFLLIVAVMAYYGGYGIVINVWDDLLGILRSLFVSFLITWVVLSLQKEAENVSRIVLVLAFFYMALTVPLTRFLVRYVVYKVFNLRREACLLGTTLEEETDTVMLLNRDWYSGFTLVKNKDGVTGRERVNACFLPLGKADDEMMKQAKELSRNIVLFSDISGLSFMNSEIKTFLSENVALITSDNGLLSTRKMILKRSFDILFSGICLLLSFPFFLVVSIAIKLESEGPVFFRHERCGRGMKAFRMLKFRTMRTKGERLFQDFLQNDEEARKDWAEKNKVKNDPRITRVGRILRMTSLDELPQLVNVIKGEMSIVGPRPDTKEALINFYKEYEGIYTRIKPGITGLWQVSGRSDVGYVKRVKLDYLYVLNWSLWLDLIIILKTVRTIISTKGAY